MRLKTYEEVSPLTKMEAILHIAYGERGVWWDFFDALYGNGNLELRILATRMN